MAATMEDIKRWLQEAQAEEATHLIVVCDTYDHEDYPVSVLPGQDIQERITHYNGENMQEVVEVYKLSMDIPRQLNEHRAFHP